MFVSIVILLLFTFRRFIVPEQFEMDAAIIGIPLMVLASIADSYHWQKNYRRALKDPTPIMEAQWRLRRAKTFSDLLILLALVLSVVLLVQYSWAVYIDPVGLVCHHRLPAAGGIPGDLILPSGPLRPDP